MDLDNAWDGFRKTHPIEKSSVAEKLDVIAAQLNEIQTDTKRTAEIVPKIMGDEAALGDVAAQPTDPMGGMADPSAMIGGAPAGEPGAEAMGEPTMGEGIEPPMGGDLGEAGTGEDLMTDELDEQSMPGTEEETPMGGTGGMDLSPEGDAGLEGGDALGLEGGGDLDLSGELPDEGLDLGEEEAALDLADEGSDIGGGDSTAMIREIINEEIDDGNYERAKKLIEALEAMSGGNDLGLEEENLEMEDEPAPEADVPTEDAPADEPAPEPESEPAKEEDSEEDKPFKESAIAKDGIAAPAAAGLGIGTDTGTIQSSEDGVGPTVAEQIAVQTANAVEGIVESVLGDGEENEPEAAEGEVEIEIEPESEESGEKKEEGTDEVEKEPFKDCDSTKKSVMPETGFSFRDMYSANLQGRDLIGEALMKSADTPEGPLAAIHPRTSMRQSFIKSVDQLSQVHPARELITGNAPDGAEQLDQVDETKTVSGGPESVRGSVDAPKQSGADKLDEVDEEKSKSGRASPEADQLDDVGKTKQARAKEGKDQLDDVDEEKSASGSNAKPKDQLDGVDAASYKKSEENGRPIMSFKDMQAFFKSGSSRPTADTTMNGDIVRPEPGSIQKSAISEPPVRMGRGIDPMKVVEKDLADYKAFKQAQMRL